MIFSKGVIGLRAFLQHLDFIDELADVLEVAVNGGIPHVGHHVDALEFLHHLRADLARVNLPPVVRLQVLHHLFDHLVQHLQADRALLTGLDDASVQLVAVKGLVPPVPFDHQQIRPFDLLVRREAVLAIEADSATTDAGAVIHGSGINHPILNAFTFGTAHQLEL